MWKTPRSITNTLVIPLLLCGINKCPLPKRLKQLHSFISIFAAFTILLMIINEHFYHVPLNIIWNVSYTVEYLCAVVYNVAYGQDFLHQFESRLTESDGNKVKRDRDVTNKTLLMVINLFVNKLYQAYKMLVSTDEQVSRVPVYIVSQIAVTCCDLECAWRFYLILLLHNRVTSVYKDLKELYPKDWYEADTIDPEKDRDIVESFKTYKSLVEIAADVTENIQVSLVLRLGTELLGIFIGLYVFVKLGGTDVTLAFIFSVANMNVMNLLPCVVAEMTKYRCKDIKVLLIQQSLKKSIKSKEKRALRYYVDHISLQHVSFRLFRSYELGADFVVNVMSVTITYCIFLLQSAKMKFF